MNKDEIWGSISLSSFSKILEMKKYIVNFFFFQKPSFEEVYCEIFWFEQILFFFFLQFEKIFFLLLIIKIIERGRDLEKYIMNFFHLKKCVVNFYDLKEYIVNFYDLKEYIVNFYYKLLIPNFFNFKKCIVHFFFLLLIQFFFLLIIQNFLFLLKTRFSYWNSISWICIFNFWKLIKFFYQVLINKPTKSFKLFEEVFHKI